MPVPRVGLRAHALVAPKRALRALERYAIEPAEIFAGADALLAVREPEGVAEIKNIAGRARRNLAEELTRMGIDRVLSIHHEINNALVGIRGNTQLLLMAPVAEQPKVRERLEVVLRESTRIKDAAASIRELRLGVAGPGTSAHAA